VDSTDNVLKLRPRFPTVQSLLDSLQENVDDIEHLAIITTSKDGWTKVSYTRMSTKEILYMAAVFNHLVNKWTLEGE
jgi:hypothetical protein